jgi:hypothetical protein
MKRTTIFLLASIFVATLSFTSCEKEDVLDPLAQDLAVDDEIESYYDEALLEAEEVSAGGAQMVELSTSVNSGSRTVVKTFSGDTVIHTITFVNFVNGDSQYERVKNGTIILKVIAHPGQPHFWRQLSFVDYSVNGNFIEGVKEIKAIAQYQVSVTLTGGKITFTDGTTYTREFERTRTWVAGYATLQYIWDDEFEIEGQAWGVNRLGLDYAHTIIEPLLARRNCRWIVKGVVEMKVDEHIGYLNYGDGECDQFATITINGETREIRLRGGRRN